MFSPEGIIVQECHVRHWKAVLVLLVSSFRVAFHAQSSLQYYGIVLGCGVIKRQIRHLVWY